MGIYIKLFDTHSEYEAYTADTENFILPNVSYCKDVANEVHYKPYVDPYAGHDYVEIGGIKWATMNVGANSVTDYGLYFQWGDTQGYTADQIGSGIGKKPFYWADYKYGNGTSSPSDTGITKYNSTDGKTVLEASDDTAQVNWGGSWRMPTEVDFNALSAATTNEWTANYQHSGVAGRLFTDKTDSSKVLFFPAAGYCFNGKVSNVSTNGDYWSSSLNTSNIMLGKRFDLNSGSCNVGDGWRCSGYSVRGVVG